MQTADVDRFLGKLREDKYTFVSRQTDWGRKLTGTRTGGVFAPDEKVFVGIFEKGLPDEKQFSDFVVQAEKFYNENSRNNRIREIYVVTPEKLDRKRYKYIVDHCNEDVAKRFEYKVVKMEAPAAVMKPEPGVGPSRLIPETLEAELPNRTEKEHILFGWRVTVHDGANSAPAILAVTQERGLLFKEVGGEVKQTGTDFKLEEITNIDVGQINGNEILRLNDQRHEYRIEHPDASFIAALFHHLHWARKGYVSGYFTDHGFDAGLVDHSGADFSKGRFVEAVRNAFTYVESRVRQESLAPAKTSGKELIDYAFRPTGESQGRINPGRDEAEREAVYFLFRGAFDLFRNPAYHDFTLPGFGRNEAFAAIAMANLLLDITRRGVEAARERPRSQ